MAKKKQAKKHKFKYAQETSTGVVEAYSRGGASTGSNGSQARGDHPAVARLGVANGGRDFSYVGADLRRIAVLAVSLVALEALLWYLFAHTGLGNAVYSFVKV